jgi:hypothetical protein
VTWFRLDDGWLRHPKHRAAGLKGRALWIAAGTWSSEQLTDGRIPKEMLPVLAIDAEIGTGHTEARRLVDIGLWDDLGDAWQFHDWHDFQPSRADVLADRAKREAASVLANHTRWHTRRGRTDPSCPHCQRSEPESESDPKRTPEPDPMLGIPPARPDPTPLLVTSEQQQSCVARGEPEPAAAAAGPATGKDHRAVVLAQAVAEVARRRDTEQRARNARNPDGWLRSTMAGIEHELLERQAYELIHAGANAHDLADLIAPLDTGPGSVPADASNVIPMVERRPPPDACTSCVDDDGTAIDCPDCQPAPTPA